MASEGLDARSLYLRRLIMKALVGGGRGHIGPSLSLVEILRVLYDSVLKYRPEDPNWAGRDRLILSKGHGCLALYAMLADKGFFPVNDLSNFCHPGSYLGGHPERGKVKGVEASTGALGHGLAIGVGQALAGRIRGTPHRVTVVMGDGEMDEGSVWESALAAAKHCLEELTVVLDCNGMQCYGSTASVLDLEPLREKWESFGFTVAEVDGHDVASLTRVFSDLPLRDAHPSAIICRTIKGKGLPFAEQSTEWHYKFEFTHAEIVAMERSLADPAEAPTP